MYLPQTGLNTFLWNQWHQYRNTKSIMMDLLSKEGRANNSRNFVAPLKPLMIRDDQDPGVTTWQERRDMLSQAKLSFARLSAKKGSDWGRAKPEGFCRALPVLARQQTRR